MKSADALLDFLKGRRKDLELASLMAPTRLQIIQSEKSIQAGIQFLEKCLDEAKAEPSYLRLSSETGIPLDEWALDSGCTKGVANSENQVDVVERKDADA